jgi:hypothetical protein
VFSDRAMKRLNITIEILTLCFIFGILSVWAQQDTESSGLTIARVKYKGGGDWYNDPSSIPNLSRFLKQHTNIDVLEQEEKISLIDEKLFSFPILFLTGHGRIVFTDRETERLRSYLIGGGFLYADDDYGMNTYFREVMKKVFPDRAFVELPFSHEIYHIHFSFPNGLPKIHEHDRKAPQGFGIFDDSGRLMVFYTYETNLSDGWADPDIHDDPPDKREAALRMGVNIIVWALLH